ncbi:MAG TPA: hypothetical protein VFY79_06195 [Dehalococcoidia bacterium]|nr:hypothetical protein [Dehalococcoidia bacterium]
MHRRHAPIEEALVAAVALSLARRARGRGLLGTTGLSPWPSGAFGEAVAVTWGLILIALPASRGR